MAKLEQTLWIIDIDGTIINVHKNQVPAWTEALQQAFSITPDESTLVSYFGKPFQSVLKNVAMYYSISEKEISKKAKFAEEIYVSSVNKHLKKTGGSILPGAENFLRLLGENGAKRAIATGNPRREGESKLIYFDLLKYFDITVFSDNRKERIEMVEEAIKQAEKKYHLKLRSHPKRVVIIGDSIHDIESAKLISASSIAVTTGHTSKYKLQIAGADMVLSGLSDFSSIKQKVASLII